MGTDAVVDGHIAGKEVCAGRGKGSETAFAEARKTCLCHDVAFVPDGKNDFGYTEEVEDWLQLVEC